MQKLSQKKITGLLVAGWMVVSLLLAQAVFAAPPRPALKSAPNVMSKSWNPGKPLPTPKQPGAIW